MLNIATRTTFLSSALALLSALAGCQETSLVGGPRDAAQPETSPAGAETAAPPDVASNGVDSAPGEVIASNDDVKGPADAVANQGPARVVFFYTPLGTVLSAWRPTVPEKGQFNLTGILAPLQPIKDRLLIVDGIDNLVHPGTPATAENATQMLLTAGAQPSTNTLGGSFDGVLARSAPGQVAFPGGIQLGVQTGTSAGLVVSYNATGDPVLPDSNPLNQWQRLFGNVGPGMAGVPPAPASDVTNYERVGRDQLTLVPAALRFDLTRVMTLSWGDVQGSTHFTWLPIPDSDYRTLATGSGVEGPARQGFIAVQTWFAAQFTTLVQALAATPEGTGSLLDHTLVVWVSETGEASTGAGRSIPVVMAGNLRGRLRNNAYVTVAGSQRDLWVTLHHAAFDTLGSIPLGDPALGDRLLPELLAP